MTELVNISVGELWDKYSILLIKQERITNKSKLYLINTEINILDKVMSKYTYKNNELFIGLKRINEELWEIEDNIRMKESSNEFDHVFIQLARSVYITNDKRCMCKKNINVLFGSTIREVKNYVKY
jgi:hypothetical protein